MAVSGWHVYVGSEIGLLKGVDIERKTFSNFNFSRNLSKDDEITSMCWGDSSEKKVFFGQRDQTVKIFDCEQKTVTSTYSLKTGDGPVVGLCNYEGQILTAVESGIVNLWDADSKQILNINAGGNLCQMIANPSKPNVIATGGEENDLKLWDLVNPQLPIFKAKNVRNDFLDLRVPVWIMDLKFRPDETIVTCTRHHQIRMYDPRAQKRPVIDMNFERYPLMSISLAHNENQVIVGSSRGRMGLIDLRKKLLVHVFKGFAGSIRCVQCHPTLPYVASCGLDRFLRIHDLNKHKLLKKIYLKTRLNCLLMKNNITDTNCVETPAPLKKEEQPMLDDEEENIWNSMDIVEEYKKRKKLVSENAQGKVKKKKKNNVEEMVSR